ncbi:zinc finger MYND domain-containing protein 12 [Octopus bimaculoides]|uniref:zinc finger MYND domain-containing protein 12 n=1 Tax=Octopus bimaculoides TaxID=37653 RepID=UPI00071D3AF6|nr:zinc finger MYND domain-containing protein 12 [Octopus bimaculoides]|eukprot:XP_014774047.1 PREDICTED: zinc finger MYND domain-containing protein 12-like [Octopus bimaculoides]
MTEDWLEGSEKVIREKMSENKAEKTPATRGSTLKLYPLANPKGTYIFCDVCGLPAWLRCKGCKIAAYCNREHRQLDWVGIHRFLCKSLIYLYNPPARSIRKLQQQALERSILNTKLELINMCLLHGHRHLFEGNYKLIIPPALQCLRLYKMLFKAEGVEWLPAYLLLAECLLGLGQTNEAANYLSLINWFETKNKVTGTKCNHMVKRTMAKLSMVRENYQQALDELAEDIYLASEKYGTLDIQTSGGYFNMANVYFFLEREEVTNSLYKKVIDIWCNHLQSLVNQKMKTSTPDIALPIKEEEYEALTKRTSFSNSSAIHSQCVICDLSNNDPSSMAADDTIMDAVHRPTSM